MWINIHDEADKTDGNVYTVSCGREVCYCLFSNTISKKISEIDLCSESQEGFWLQMSWKYIFFYYLGGAVKCTDAIKNATDL